ncbi:MAG: hypothetical protein A2Z20_04155 [Bdellovibrionales bacterium RBG_16_40_8]|nr:MAG: hypothetical protein A2Z20_04155 [Bdellovibrionales bacterium RBG_16_40_8]
MNGNNRPNINNRNFDTVYRNIWLLGFVLLLIMMVSVGGTTRMTRSGLSITEWQPVSGILPPINESDWVEYFEKYKVTPEFQEVNSHFALSDYKKIFFWEYLHRLLGRVIFFYALIPGLWLWRKKMAEGKLVFALPAMVALQGLVGWLMVKSGLKSLPAVSPFMLALHFFMALATLIVAYYYLSKRRSRLVVQLTKLQKVLLFILGVLLLFQVFYGCLTSGFRAGLYFCSFPKMGDSYLPDIAMSITPVLNNFFINPVMIQWVHRWLGIGVLIIVYLSAIVFIAQSGRQFFRAFIHLISIVTIQVLSGILLILWVVPIPLAIFHQFFATLVVLGFCNIIFRIKAPIHCNGGGRNTEVEAALDFKLSV